MGKFINPFTDWGFKHIFGQEITKELLLSFLNDLFAGEFQIADLTFKNPGQLGISKDSRGVVFDIYCTTLEGKNIIVEMQNRAQPHFIDRALYYTSRVIVDQGKRGEWNYCLTPVYTICFMNFIDSGLTPGKFRTDIVLADRDTHELFSGKMRFIFLELPSFTKEESECETDFERWIYVLKNMETLQRLPFKARNAVFQKLEQIVDIAAMSKEDRMKYDESIKVYRDQLAVIEFERTKGLEQGFAIGKEEGIKQGREEGREEGRENERLKIARNLKAAGLAPETIANATGLAQEQIAKL